MDFNVPTFWQYQRERILATVNICALLGSTRPFRSQGHILLFSGIALIAMQNACVPGNES